MASITLRSSGSRLTNTQVDNNFTNLNNDKLETSLKGAVNGLAELDANGVLKLTQTRSNTQLTVYNGTGSTINKGQVVYINGVQGSDPSVALADSDAESTSSRAIGVAAANITNASTGLIIVDGIADGLNTSAFTAGAELYISSTAGALTSTKPTYPQLVVSVGICVVSNASTGKIFVRLSSGASSGSVINAADNQTDASYYPVFGTSQGTNIALASDAGLTYNPSSGLLTAAIFDGAGTARGGGNDTVFWENDTTINNSYTINTNKNAMTAGPITVANGVTVTVPDGSVWSIV